MLFFCIEAPSTVRPRSAPMRRDWNTLLKRIESWRKRARWVQCKLKAVPTAIRVVVICIAILAVFSATNVVLSCAAQADGDVFSRKQRVQ